MALFSRPFNEDRRARFPIVPPSPHVHFVLNLYLVWFLNSVLALRSSSKRQLIGACVTPVKIALFF